MIKRAKGLAQFILGIGVEEGKEVERGKRKVYDVVSLKVMAVCRLRNIA